MANLLDTIRQNSQPQQQGVTDETQKLQTLLRAKSGRAVEGAPTAASNLGEQQVVTQTNQTLGQVGQAAQIQATGLAQQQQGQQQTQQIQEAGIAQDRRFDTVQNNIRTNEILSNLERNRGQLDLDRDKSSLEQLGFSLRLKDQKYLDNLKREGQRARLDDSNRFNEALTESVLGDNRTLLEKQLGNRSILATNDREFSKSLASMNIDMAYDIFKNDMKAEKERALYSGIGALATAGIGAAASMKSATPTETAQAEYANETSDVNTMKDMKGY